MMKPKLNIAKQMGQALWQGLLRRGPIDTARIIWSTFKDAEFDELYQTDSAARVDVRQTESGHAAAAKAVFYQASRAAPLRLLFKQLRLDPAEGFVDVGSGKGRALILAAESGLRWVKGIEFSQSLHQTAQRNIGRVQALFPQTHFELLRQDVAEYQIAPEDVTFYMYDPFEQAQVLSFLKKIELAVGRHGLPQEEERPFRVIYHNNFWDLTPHLAGLRLGRYQRSLVFKGNRFLVFSNRA